MSEEWYYAHDGQQIGPISASELQTLITNRRLKPEDLVWREGLPDWKPAKSIRGLLAAPTPPPPPPKVTKTAEDKFCHECGAVIRLKAEICPKCGVRQQAGPSHNQSESSIGSDGRGIITTPVLISAIGNVVIGGAWIATCLGAPIGVLMIALCVVEFMFYSNSDQKSPEQIIRTSGTLAIFEIICGMLNIVSFVCGILVLINKAKYARSLNMTRPVIASGNIGPYDNTQSNSTGGMIPYENLPALFAYYLGVFSVIPLFPIGWTAVILGIIGLMNQAQHPEARGGVHAWIGIVVGGIFGLLWTVVTILMVIAPR